METQLQIRIEYTLNLLHAMIDGIAPGTDDLIGEEPLYQAEGYGYHNADEPCPHLFLGTPLEEAWEVGCRARMMCEETIAQQGTQEQWDALTPEEQHGHWEEFHDRCFVGTADGMFFYNVMMSQHLADYVGD